MLSKVLKGDRMADQVIDVLQTILGKTLHFSDTTVRQHIIPQVQNLLSTHGDITSILLLVAVAYFSILILGRASRWMYSLVMTIVRLAFFALFAVAAIYAIRGNQNGTTDFKQLGGMMMRWMLGRQSILDLGREILGYVKV